MISPPSSYASIQMWTGVYMPCNKWRTISVIERIEQASGKPVITNTQAWVWDALRLMKMQTPIAGYGRLLSEFK